MWGWRRPSAASRVAVGPAHRACHREDRERVVAEHPDISLVRRGYEAFSTGDVTTLSEIIAPDASQFQPGNGPLSGEHRGRDAILEFYGRLAVETDGSFRVDLEHLYADGRGKVVATHRATAERQGRRLDSRACLIFTVADGMARDIHGCLEDVDAWNEFWT
jgi:ketosteroid isomerase-like protein